MASALLTSATSAKLKKPTTTDKIRSVLCEIQSHEKSALFSAASSHNPDLKMTLDVVRHKMDNNLYKKPRDFVQDMKAVFTVDADSQLASAASSFQILLQCLVDNHGLTRNTCSSSKNKHRRTYGGKHPKSAGVFDFVAEFEEDLSSGFLFEGEQFLTGGRSSDDEEDDDIEVDIFGSDDDSSAEDFVPLSFSFEQESVLDGRSPDGLYSELLDLGWAEWDPTSSDPASPKTSDSSDDGDSSSPSSPLSINTSTSTLPSPISSGVASSANSKRGKRQRSASLRAHSAMRWSKEELLYKITNELPSEKLEGIIMIVNPSLEFGDTEEEDLEFDINALDEVTLYRLEEYVHSCLVDDDEGNESMMDGLITITHTIEETLAAASPRKKRTKTKAHHQSSPARNTRKPKTTRSTTTAAAHPSPVTPRSTKSTQRRKNATPAKARSPSTALSKTKTAAAAAAAAAVKTTQVIETTICHFVEQDEDFNYIPHSRGARLNTLVPEAFEVFRSEQVIKVQKNTDTRDTEEEEVDII